jgi:hypothetical protein
LISKPFSIKLFSFGSGGTFPTHALIRCPPTDMVHDAHSPLRLVFFLHKRKCDHVESVRNKERVEDETLSHHDNRHPKQQDMRTYFLQEYFGFTPNAAQAFLSGEPALKSFFWPL